MLRVNGKYDGEKVVFESPIKNRKPVDVIVIFPEDDKEESIMENSVLMDDVTGRTISRYLDGNPSFDFLQEPEEDIYSDEDLKKRYK
ncbi:MAG: hypothetical protein MUE99_06400 [Chitinophagaceae bacterium]|nr:hypothetical protein [Chitinophagaceae bacterium]